MARYRGRFAPSPTGPLHFGSLVAATASYLDARKRGGTWLVRMEDVDEPRSVPGAEQRILKSLLAHGFRMDEEVVRQSERKPLYQSALDALIRSGLAYPCGCSRKEAAGRYPGTCRAGLLPGKTPRAWRVRVPSEPIAFPDRVMGEQAESLEETSGDFVVLRADGYFAYQLAVVVDDAAQGITHVVRGADLLDSTPRQLFLQEALGYGPPAYLHVPVALSAAGEKLSKQTRAPAIDDDQAARNLRGALRFLGQDPPSALEDIGRLWAWAIEAWDVDRIPKTPRIQTDT